MPSNLEIPLLRDEWVKMEYPDEPIVVGVITTLGENWVCFHETVPGQFSVEFDSPGGVDFGTVRYLIRVGVTAFINYPKGSGRVYVAPVARLLDGMVAHPEWCADTETVKGQFRRRVFLPRLEWQYRKTKEPLKTPHPPVREETRISTEGVVLWRTRA